MIKFSNIQKIKFITDGLNGLLANGLSTLNLEEFLNNNIIPEKSSPWFNSDNKIASRTGIPRGMVYYATLKIVVAMLERGLKPDMQSIDEGVIKVLLEEYMMSPNVLSWIENKFFSRVDTYLTEIKQAIITGQADFISDKYRNDLEGYIRTIYNCLKMNDTDLIRFIYHPKIDGQELDLFKYSVDDKCDLSTQLLQKGICRTNYLAKFLEIEIRKFVESQKGNNLTVNSTAICTNFYNERFMKKIHDLQDKYLVRDGPKQQDLILKDIIAAFLTNKKWLVKLIEGLKIFIYKDNKKYTFIYQTLIECYKPDLDNIESILMGAKANLGEFFHLSKIPIL